MSLDHFISRTRIAYLSMEIALRPEAHTYSGGLGVLAGDTARSSADLNLPMVFVTLASRKGYLQQRIIDGEQIDVPDPWPLEDLAEPLPARVALLIQGRWVWVRPWLYLVSCSAGNQAPVILLDTDITENDQRDRAITDRLYGGDAGDRLKQEFVLGVGGMQILDALGFAISKYHLNEGHAALLTLALLKRRGSGVERSGRPRSSAAAVERVRERCVFTTHTPVEAGHDQFPYNLVQEILGDWADLDLIKPLAGEASLNMTRLALSLAGYVNGVARRHAETSRRMFPGYDVRAVTNGVHPAYWTHAAMASVFDAFVKGWRHEPELMTRLDQAPDEAIWRAHQSAKTDLANLVKARTGRELRPEHPVLGFARRMTGYKRPDLIFSDVTRLLEIHRRYPLQIVLAGKAHPRDEGGKKLIADIHRYIDQLSSSLPIVFIPNYDLEAARLLVAGCDIWLNTPLPPLEASGTSGMKAGLNGALNLSVLDGWWIEGWIEGVTGWAVGRDGDAAASHGSELYQKLEVALALYYGDRDRWTWMMKQSISKLGSFFNSHRMMRRYASEAYLCQE